MHRKIDERTQLSQQRSSSNREEGSQWSCVEDGRTVSEEAAKTMLRFLDDNGDMKVGVSELKEHANCPAGKEWEGPEDLQTRRGGGVYCQFGEMERANEESSGVGKAVSRYDAGSEAVE